MNIVLIGARGSGKSAVASALARDLDRAVYSTDAAIEQRAGCGIQKFVEREGWDAFRDLESEAVREIAGQLECIIDTGGGVVLRQSNIDTLRACGRVFWLQATVAVLARRIRGDANRPSLTGGQSSVDEIAEVLEARTPLYTAAAHHTVDSGERAADAVAKEISELFFRE